MDDDQVKEFLLGTIKELKRKNSTLRVLSEGRVKVWIANAFTELTREQMGAASDKETLGVMVSVEPLSGPRSLPLESLILRDDVLLLLDESDAGVLLQPPNDGIVTFFGRQGTAKIAVKLLRRREEGQKPEEQNVTVTCSLTL